MNKLPLTLSLAFAVIVSMARFAEAGETVTLFDGKNLDAWVIENNGQFSVEDGVLRVNKGTGWLRSREEFGDFTLVMEFRFLEEGANSGVFVRTKATSNDDENGWPNNGYQVQCMDTIEGEHPLASMIPYGAPDFKHSTNVEALRRAYKPTGEWQTFEISCVGETISVKLNGEVVTQCTEIKNRSGHVGIQGEHGLLEFRKIAIRPAG
jgi:hypothetical protein